MFEIYYDLLKDIFNDFYFLDEFRILFRYDKETICCELAYRGMIDCLKYAHENGFSWDKNVCVVASKNGHLDCLIYAHENGCPWTEKTSYMAYVFEHFDCLNYAIENGCPFDDDILNDK
jgi:hypothetical protein